MASAAHGRGAATLALAVALIAAARATSDPTAYQRSLVQRCNKPVYLYVVMGCEPKYAAKDDACPSHFECPPRTRNACHVFGEKLSKGQNSEEARSPCGLPCTCTDNDNGFEMSCPAFDCPNWDVPENCHYRAKLGVCCPNKDYICKPYSKDVGRCKWLDTEYVEGVQAERHDTCQTCVCEKNGEWTCEPKRCDFELNHQAELARHCALGYFVDSPDEAKNKHCCPRAVLCPENGDKIQAAATPLKGGSTCQYGNQTLNAGDHFERTINEYGKNREMRCECSVGPYVTCVQTNADAKYE